MSAPKTSPRQRGTSVAPLIGAALVLGAACSTPSSRERGAGDGGAGGGGAAGTGAVGGDAGTGGTGDPGFSCEGSQIGPPLARRLTRTELQNTLFDAFPQIRSSFRGMAMSSDASSKHGFNNDADLLVVGNQTAQEINISAEALADALLDDATLPGVLPCASTTPDVTCAGQFVTDYGRRLFRRAVSAEEQTNFTNLYSSVAAKSDFKTGLRWMIVALVQSPRTLYRSEIGAEAGGEQRLSQIELASELAYTFSGTAPSEELLGKAERGELSSPDILVAEARVLLSTPGGHEVVAEFFREWLGYPNVVADQKPNVPEFAAVRDAMAEETRLFVDNVVYQDNGRVDTLFTAPYTMANPSLAAFYGFTPGAGAGFSKVERPEGRGTGILGQGSVLSTRGLTDSSSPTKRGLMIFTKLLCFEKPPPPGVVPNPPTVMPGVKTTRQRYEEVHTQDAVCKTCHEFFDPAGFGLEHFDEAGRYRETEVGLPIDPSGHVVDDGLETLFEFDSLEGLNAGLASEPRVKECVSGSLATYAFGGAGDTACTASVSAREALAKGEIGILDYIAELARAPHFSVRKR